MHNSLKIKSFIVIYKKDEITYFLQYPFLLFQLAKVRSLFPYPTQGFELRRGQEIGQAWKVLIKFPKPDNLQRFLGKFLYIGICGTDRRFFRLGYIRHSSFAHRRSAILRGQRYVFFSFQNFTQTTILIAEIFGNDPKIRK